MFHSYATSQLEGNSCSPINTATANGCQNPRLMERSELNGPIRDVNLSHSKQVFWGRRYDNRTCGLYVRVDSHLGRDIRRKGSRRHMIRQISLPEPNWGS
jgi:hypothetical protein